MAEAISICVIIPTFRRGSVLLQTLADLEQQVYNPDEIIVVDQTPDDEQEPGVLETLSAKAAEGSIKLIKRSQAHVYAARNAGAKAASSDVLLYIDDDVTLPSDFVKNHIRHFTDPEIMAVVGPVPHSSKYTLNPVPAGFTELPPADQAFIGAVDFNQPLQSIACMHAGNFSIRRNALERVSGWDEHILTYGDRDMGIRLFLAGLRMDYDPEAVLIHKAVPMGGTRISDARSPWSSWQRCVSIHYLAFKYLHGMNFIRYGLWRAARYSFLLKRNLTRPWRWIPELFGYFRAMFVAAKWAREFRAQSNDIKNDEYAK